MTPREILEHYDFFEQASRSLQDEFLAASERVSLPVGFHPFQEGSGCPGVAFVGNGDIRVYKVSREGREVTLYHVGPGETCLLTLNAAMGTSLYPASAVVEAPVEAVAVPVESFRSWVRGHDAMRVFVFEQMADRISDLMALIHEVVFRRMDRRVADYLASRYAGLAPGAPVEVTHGAIAAELGSAREVISRVLKELEREGAVMLGRGRIELLDRDLLHRLGERRSEAGS